METQAITHISVEALHGRHQLVVDLKPGLNILHGRNGTGKTTFLHILANLLDRDIARFNHLRFSQIVVKTDAGTTIVVNQNRGAEVSVTVTINGKTHPPIGEDAETSSDLRAELKTHLGGRPVYLPAFRSVLEAISQGRSSATLSDPQRELAFRKILEREEAETTRERSVQSRYAFREVFRAIASKTLLCRDWFGSFVPTVRFPSLWEVAEELSEELQRAQFAVASTDREAFSGVFGDVLKAVLEPSADTTPEDLQVLLKNIEEHLTLLQGSETGVPKVYQEIASMVREQGRSFTDTKATSILKVYDKVLRERSAAQKLAFAQIRTFESSVNRFLIGKRLTVINEDLRKPLPIRNRTNLITLDGGRPRNLQVLSSGERHVLTLLFSATHMSVADGVLLIDEPELSLHVDWQQMILDELMKQAGSRQIIVCTHAPEVAALHREVMTELVLRASIPGINDGLNDAGDEPLLPE